MTRREGGVYTVPLNAMCIPLDNSILVMDSEETDFFGSIERMQILNFKEIYYKLSEIL